MHDPHAEREAAKYDKPIASRELILELLEQHNTPLSAQKIAELLNMQEEQLIALQRRLFAMHREGQLIKNRKSAFSIPDRSALLKGTVLAHRDGYGFLQVSEGDDLYLSQREMRKVFNGDVALAAITHIKANGKKEAEIVEVVERHTEQIVGKLLIDGEKMRVIPQSPKINHSIFIEQEHTISAAHEQLVIVDITRQPDAYRAPKGIIVDVLGDELDPGMEIEIAVRNFGIPHTWPEELLIEAKALGEEPKEADKKHRVDLRDLPLVTIDGEDARDFDDAVYCEKKPSGGWRLWVAIADVSHYVNINSAFDTEAQLRATSVYFPEKVIPMLPEELSNGLCSLKPQVDRLCMVCEMTISATGKLSGYEFYEAVMHSHARLTYTEVGKVLAEKDDRESLIRQQYKKLLKPLDELKNLYGALKGQRNIRGAINFETTETKIIFDSERKIEDIVPITRNDAHKLIEECMLCANVATAKFLSKYKIPALFRVHESPSERKLENLRGFISERGLSLPGGDEPSPMDYQSLFSQLEDREDASVIQTMMLRSMNQAVYEPDNKGHFGLAYDAYAHFTSPIRRYPDLLVHRAIRSIIRSEANNKNVRRCDGQKPLKKSAIYPYDLEALLVLGEQCSMAERRADDATRDVVDWLKCEYLQERIGEEFSGKIAAVAPFGFFVELDDLFVEGMVHVSQLGNDFYQYEQAKQRLIGENSRQVFNLGDKVEVRISKVELDDRKVHLTLAGHKGIETAKTSGKRLPKKDRKGRRKSERIDATQAEEKNVSRDKHSDDKNTKPPRRKKPKTNAANSDTGKSKKTLSKKTESNVASTKKKTSRKRTKHK